MYYKILLNGIELGIFGHKKVQNIHLAVGGGPANMYVFVSAVCEDNGTLVHYHWLQRDISETDIVQVQPTTETNVPEPQKKFVMGRTRREPSPERLCDFCQRKESETLRVVYIDEHRPSICESCVELCSEILRAPVERAVPGDDYTS